MFRHDGDVLAVALFGEDEGDIEANDTCSARG